MAKKKWSSKAFEKATGSPLGSLDNGASIVSRARKDRKGIVQKLLLIANGSGDPASRAKAKGLINRIKRELGPSDANKD